MEYLYVCHFSNGHIKVGRSIDPQARIASHADRVGCLGIELAEHFIVECIGHSAPSEKQLIELCAQHAVARNKNEWFVGIDYVTACEWATECAKSEHKKVVRVAMEWEMSKAQAIKLLGGTPAKAAKAMGYKAVQTIYMWPDVLPQQLEDQVRGAALRVKPANKPRKTKAVANV